MFDPAAIPATIVNRALAHEQSLRTRLAAHAGAVVKVAAGPGAAVFSINADGTLAEAAHGAQPTLTLTIRPSGILALLHDTTRFDEFVHADGDVALAATIKDLSATLPWFVERLFGEAFGAIAGQRLADAGRSLLGIPDYAATRIHASVGSYVRDEARLAATNADADAFGTDIRDLGARVDALVQRIDRIAAARKP